MKRGISSAAALALGAALLLGGCVQKGVDYVDVTEDIVDRFPFEAEPVELNPQQAEESNTYAVFHTTAGDITVMLYPEESPDEVSCFIEQAKAGAYDGQQFVYVRRDGLIESDNVASDDAEAADSTSESDSATESTSVSESASFPSAAQSTPAEGISSSIGAPSSDERTSEESASSAEAAESKSASETGSTLDGGSSSIASSQSTSDTESAVPSESIQEDGYTEEELADVALPELPQDVQGAQYSDNLHHYYGAVGISRKNEDGGDRLHFVVEQTKPEDERLVPVTLYMRRLINQRLAQLNALTQQQPFTDIQLAAFEARMNEEVQALSDGVIPEEYAQRYGPINEMYSQVGGQWALDYQYPLIGQIVEGQNVADAISQAKVDAQTRKPKQDIVIEYVEIVEP